VIEPRPLCVGAALALLVGCTRDTAPVPSTLIDGSPARAFPVALEGVEGARIATRVRVILPGSGGGPRPTGAPCARVEAPRSPVVERVGVTGATITFFDVGGHGVHACDAIDLSGSRVERWCAHAFGRVLGARLRDPRLSITCRGPGGEPVGFAWLQPSRAAAYVVVRQPGHAEVYATARMAPVRVATVEVDLATSSATFAISEHAQDGSRIRSYDVEAHVAS
jgi:hypothetical protein